MNDIPAELKYTQNHEWLRASGQGRYVVGITDHAQVSLGEVIFVDLPAVGESFIAGENCAVTESAKAASDVYAPVSGTIVAVNEALESTPDLVNRAPYGEGWFFIMQVDDAEDESELEILMDAEAYQCFLEEQQEEEI